MCDTRRHTQNESRDDVFVLIERKIQIDKGSSHHVPFLRGVRSALKFC